MPFHRPRWTVRSLVPPARLELALLDPQVVGERGVVLPHIREELLCVLKPDAHLKRIAERVARARAVVDDGVEEHSSRMMSATAHAG